MNVVIVGAGVMAAEHCARLAKMDNVKISAIVDCDVIKAENLARSFNTEFLDSVDSLVNIKENIDFSIIAVPNFLHIETIKAVSKYTKNIICEKPVCIKYSDYQALKKFLRENDLNIMVAHVVRVWDSFTAMKKIIKANENSLKSITIKRRQPNPNWSSGNWLLDRKKSGGIIYDLAIHDIDYIVNMLGLPLKVSSCMDSSATNCTVLLHYKEFSVTLVSSWCMPRAYNEQKMETVIEVLCDGMLAVYDDKISKQEITAYTKQTEKITFDDTDAYLVQLTEMINFIQNRIVNNEFSLSTVENTMKICEMIGKQN